MIPPKRTRAPQARKRKLGAGTRWSIVSHVSRTRAPSRANAPTPVHRVLLSPVVGDGREELEDAFGAAEVADAVLVGPDHLFIHIFHRGQSDIYIMQHTAYSDVRATVGQTRSINSYACFVAFFRVNVMLWFTTPLKYRDLIHDS